MKEKIYRELVVDMSLSEEWTTAKAAVMRATLRELNQRC